MSSCHWLVMLTPINDILSGRVIPSTDGGGDMRETNRPRQIIKANSCSCHGAHGSLIVRLSVLNSASSLLDQRENRPLSQSDPCVPYISSPSCSENNFYKSLQDCAQYIWPCKKKITRWKEAINVLSHPWICLTYSYVNCGGLSAAPLICLHLFSRNPQCQQQEQRYCLLLNTWMQKFTRTSTFQKYYETSTNNVNGSLSTKAIALNKMNQFGGRLFRSKW